MFSSLIMTEVAKADAVFTGFWHEPGRFLDRLRILAPGTLDCPFRFGSYVHRQEVQLYTIG